MDNRITKEKLLGILQGWDGFLKRKLNLIACGGTALTLLGIKPSTKDIDFMVPVPKEYDSLIKLLKDLGYKPATGAGWARDEGFVFDLFRGKSVHTTELLFSPLETGGSIPFRTGTEHIYVGILNFYDIIISKMFRGAPVDTEDCLMLFEAKKGQIDIEKLKSKYMETAHYDVNPERMMQNLEVFLKKLGDGEGNERKR